MPAAPMYDLVMFDLDGTLVDTAGDIADAVNALLAEQALPAVSEAQVRGWIGHGSRRLLERVFAACAATPAFDDTARCAALLARYERLYERRCGTRSRTFAGVDDALRQLVAHGTRLAIVSNRESRLAHAVLRAHGLERHFAPIVGGDSLAARKPDALPLHHCMARHRVAAPRALMVGDSAIDAAAARAAGVDCWLVDYGYDGGVPVAECGAERIIASLEAVADAIVAAGG